VIHWT